MPRPRAAKSAQKTEKVGKAKGTTAVKAPSNCGSGAGGFKPGNVCGKGKRAKLAADIRAARKHSLGSTDDAAIRAKALGLKAHRRGKEGSVDNEAALHLRASLGRDKASQARTDTIRIAKAEVRAAHVAQRFRNSRDADRQGVYESPRPEPFLIRVYRDRIREHGELKESDQKIVAERGHELEAAEKLRNKLRDKMFDYGVSARTRNNYVKRYNQHEEVYQKLDSEIGSAKYRLENDVYSKRIESDRQRLDDLTAQHEAHGPNLYQYAEHQKNHPDLIPPGRIQDRIEQYRVGDVKIDAINKIHKHYEAEDVILSDQNTKLFGQMTRRLKLQNDRIAKDPEASDRTMAKVDKIQVQIDRIDAKIKEGYAKQRELSDRRRRDIVSVLEVDKPMNFVARDIRPGVVTDDGPLSPVTDGTRRSTIQAHEFLGKVVARADVATVRVEIGEGPGYRAHYQNNNGENPHIQAAVNEDIPTMVHEYGHAIDYQAKTGDHATNVRAQEFLKHRVGDEPKIDLFERFKTGKAGEMGRKDKFEASQGSEYRAYYTGKDYGDRASEITSMGMERLYMDPVKFVNSDREYAKFILGTLDGSLR